MLLSTAALVLAARLLVRSDHRLVTAVALGACARARAARPRLDALDGRRRRRRARRRGRHPCGRAPSRSASRLAVVARRRAARSRSVVRAPARRATTARSSASPAPRAAPLVAPAARVLRRRRPARRSSRRRTGPRSRNRFVPVAYAETWGDYYGVWRWLPVGGPPDGERPSRARDDVDRRAAVHAVTAVAGWLALLGLAIRHPGRAAERQLVALLPLAALAGVLYFATSYPTPDGDTVKGSFMLTAVPAWAACFGFAFDELRARLRRGSDRSSSAPSRLLAARRRPVPARHGRGCDRAAPRRGVALPPRRRSRSSACLVVAETAGWLVYRSVHARADGARADGAVPAAREAAVDRADAADDPIATTAARRRARDPGRGRRRPGRDRNVGREAARSRRRIGGPRRRIELASTSDGRVLYVWEQSRVRPRRSARRCTTAGTSDGRRAPLRSPVVTRRPLHVRGTARRHRERVRAGRRDDRRCRPRPARPRALPRRPPGARPARATTPATSPRSRRSSQAHDVRLVVPLTDLDQEIVSAARAALAPALVLAPLARGVPHDGGQVPRARVLRGARDPEPAHLAARRRPGRRALPAARQGARGVRLAPHLPRGRRGAARLPPRHDAGRLDGAGASASARSSRSTSSATSTAAASTRSRAR